MLGMQVRLSDDVLITRKVYRLLDMEDAQRKEKVQARLLTIGEVEFLEQCLLDEKMSTPDTVACGCMLFCLYSRSRWSDLKKVYGFLEDMTEKDGRISGYLECMVRESSHNL